MSQNKNRDYVIEKDIFLTVFKKIGNIKESLEVLNYFCKNKLSCEYSVILPILNFIYDESDMIYAYFINKKYAEPHEKITFKM